MVKLNDDPGVLLGVYHIANAIHHVMNWKDSIDYIGVDAEIKEFIHLGVIMISEMLEAKDDIDDENDVDDDIATDGGGEIEVTK